MAAITQTTPNLLGGVSRQTDDKKRDGSFVDIKNGYSDPTNGLVKRGGLRFLWNMATPDALLDEASLDGAHWFFIQVLETVTEANKNLYPYKQVGDTFPLTAVGAICKGNVFLWNAITGEFITVDNQGANYLRRPDDGDYYEGDDFHTCVVLDTAIFCNKQIITKFRDTEIPIPTPNAQATVRVNNVIGNTIYGVYLNDAPYEYTSENTTSIDAIMEGLAALIRVGGYTVDVYKTSIEITKGDTFKCVVGDSLNNTLMNSYQDNIDDISLLAKPSKPDRRVTVTNTNAAEDDYYLKYSEEKEDWEESLKPGVSPGFDPNTMPHRLIYKEQDDGSYVWTFEPCPWEDRLVGDDENNPLPSFVGRPIAASFFYNNRMGLLSYEHVNLSRENDVFQFTGETQLAVLDTDNVDLNASTTRPVTLYDVIVQQQGIVLFGERQQFFLSSPDNGVITPSNSVIKTICNYELDGNVSPVDVGTTIGMVSKDAIGDYSRLMLLQGDGLEVDPIVVDISKVVSGWLPKATMMATSPQNSFVALANENSKEVFIYRFYNDGKEDKMQAWQRWVMPGLVKACNISEDMMYFVTLQNGITCTSVISINDVTKSRFQLSDKSMTACSPCIDFISFPKSAVYVSETRSTKLYVSFPYIPGGEAVAVATLPTTGAPMNATNFEELFAYRVEIPDQEQLDSDSGWWKKGEIKLDDEGEAYLEVPGDWTEYHSKSGVVVGYNYEFEAYFPTFYFRNPSKGGACDYTASLIVNRIKMSVGKTGAVIFKVNPKGSDEWVPIKPVIEADYYMADTLPVVDEYKFTLPINQRNTNFDLKVVSDLPFPVSLVSMTWEGQYSPRFYRRM